MALFTSRHKGQTPYGTTSRHDISDTTQSSASVRFQSIVRSSKENPNANPFAPASNKSLHRLACSQTLPSCNKACTTRDEPCTQSEGSPRLEHFCRVPTLALILLKTVRYSIQCGQHQHALQSGSLRCFQHILLPSYRPSFMRDNASSANPSNNRICF